MRRLGFVLLAIVAGMGIGAVAFADGDWVWPSGTNPKTGAPIMGFCDAERAVIDASLLMLTDPPPEMVAILSQLYPSTSDANDVAVATKDPISFTTVGNGILDCSIELKLVEEVLRDTSFNVNGLTHAMVHSAWNANDARFAVDVGPYWGLLGSIWSGMPQVLKGYMIIGDGDGTYSDGTPPEYGRVDATGSAGFVKAVLFLMGSAVPILSIDVNHYVRMPQYFSKTGDADGDGFSNECEYAVYGPANYVANALNPDVHPTRAQCGMPEFAFISVRGGGWHEEWAPLELAVAVIGDIGTITYQWFKDGVPIPEGVEAVYRVADPTAADSGVYHCQATDQSKAVIDTGPIPVDIVADGSLPAAGLPGMCVVLCAMAGLGAVGISRRHNGFLALARRNRS